MPYPQWISRNAATGPTSPISPVSPEEPELHIPSTQQHNSASPISPLSPEQPRQQSFQYRQRRRPPPAFLNTRWGRDEDACLHVYDPLNPRKCETLLFPPPRSPPSSPPTSPHSIGSINDFFDVEADSCSAHSSSCASTSTLSLPIFLVPPRMSGSLLSDDHADRLHDQTKTQEPDRHKHEEFYPPPPSASLSRHRDAHHPRSFAARLARRPTPYPTSTPHQTLRHTTVPKNRANEGRPLSDPEPRYEIRTPPPSRRAGSGGRTTAWWTRRRPPPFPPQEEIDRYVKRSLPLPPAGAIVASGRSCTVRDPDTGMAVRVPRIAVTAPGASAAAAAPVKMPRRALRSEMRSLRPRSCEVAA